MNKEMTGLKNKNTATVRGDLQQNATMGIISAKPPAAAELAAAAMTVEGSRFFMPRHTTY